MRNKKNVVCVRSYTLKPKWSMISNILRIGVPTGLENGMFQVGKILIAAQVAGYGTVAIAANAVGFSVSGVQIIPGIGLPWWANASEPGARMKRSSIPAVC